MTTSILVFLGVLLTAAIWCAFYLLGKALFQHGYERGKTEALQTRPAEILKAKTEGMMAERERWLRSGRVDLKTLAPDSEATYGGGIQVHDLANAVIEVQNKSQQ